MVDPESDQIELAKAILAGAERRPQAFGAYFSSDGRSCALGAAYEGVHLLPEFPGPLHPRLERLFNCLEYVIKRCPEGCRKSLPLAALIVHLNDDHHWSREAIAAWLMPHAEHHEPQEIRRGQN
jgi:hypothetical protein